MTVTGMNTYDERHSFIFAPVASSMIKNITGFTKLLLNVIYVYIFRESQKMMHKSDVPLSQSFHSLERKRGASRQRGNRVTGSKDQLEADTSSTQGLWRSVVHSLCTECYLPNRPCCELNIHCPACIISAINLDTNMSFVL